MAPNLTCLSSVWQFQKLFLSPRRSKSAQDSRGLLNAIKYKLVKTIQLLTRDEYKSEIKIYKNQQYRLTKLRKFGQSFLNDRELTKLTRNHLAPHWTLADTGKQRPHQEHAVGCKIACKMSENASYIIRRTVGKCWCVWYYPMDKNNTRTIPVPRRRNMNDVSGLYPLQQSLEIGSYIKMLVCRVLSDR